MKMLDKDYRELKTAINKVLRQYPTVRSDYAKAKHSATRLRFDLYYKAQDLGHIARDYTNRLRKYLNDSHIETALKKILKESKLGRKNPGHARKNAGDYGRDGYLRQSTERLKLEGVGGRFRTISIRKLKMMSKRELQAHLEFRGMMVRDELKAELLEDAIADFNEELKYRGRKNPGHARRIESYCEECGNPMEYVRGEGWHHTDGFGRNLDLDADHQARNRKNPGHARKNAVQSPNSSGQGFDPDHSLHPFHDILVERGLSYSHSTPFRVRGDSTPRILHTYRLNKDFAVSVNRRTRGRGWAWEGKRRSGVSQQELDQYLKGAVKRYARKNPGHARKKPISRREAGGLEEYRLLVRRLKAKGMSTRGNLATLRRRWAIVTSRRIKDKPPKKARSNYAGVGKVQTKRKADKLTPAKRRKLPKSDFGLPSKAPGVGSYPIPDIKHAAAAVAYSTAAVNSGALSKANQDKIFMRILAKFPQAAKWPSMKKWAR